MKNKIFKIVLMIILAFTLLGCKKEVVEEPTAKTYKSDGTYLSYVINKTSSPSISYVKVVVKNDKIDSVEIDEISSTVTDNVLTFNEKSKKELKYDYQMHYNDYTSSLEDNTTGTTEGYTAWLKSNNKLEWFEQADLIEKELLNKYTNIMDNDNYEFTVADVTISTSTFTTLIKEAINQAKNGKLKAFKVYEDDVIMGTADVSDNVVTNYKLDMLQGSMSSDNVFSFKEKTKQELKYDYHMHYYTYVATLEDSTTATEAGYIAWLKANNKLEWFEQVDKLASVYESNVNIEFDDTGSYTNTELASVTIHDNQYISVLDTLKSYGK